MKVAKGSTDNARVAAANAILDRAYGKPVQVTENHHDFSDPLSELLASLAAAGLRVTDKT
jgi:hypothetical protein